MVLGLGSGFLPVDSLAQPRVEITVQVFVECPFLSLHHIESACFGSDVPGFPTVPWFPCTAGDIYVGPLLSWQVSPLCCTTGDGFAVSGPILPDECH